MDFHYATVGLPRTRATRVERTPGRIGMGWTDERVELLTKLWTTGFSASQIAKRIGGITRNAVIGKVHRLGLARERPHKTHAKKTRKRVKAEAPKKQRMPVFPREPLPEELERPAKLVAFADLEEHQCRYIFGDTHTADHGFCGRTKAPGSSYCEAHAHVCSDHSTKRRYRKPHPQWISYLGRFVTPIAFEVAE